MPYVEWILSRPQCAIGYILSIICSSQLRSHFDLYRICLEATNPDVLHSNSQVNQHMEIYMMVHVCIYFRSIFQGTCPLLPYRVRQTEASLKCLNIECLTSRAKHTSWIKQHESKLGIEGNLFVFLGPLPIFTLEECLSQVGPLLLTWINISPSVDSNHMPSKVWDEITYPYPNLNGHAVKFWEWISSFIPHFKMDVITYPCWD